MFRLIRFTAAAGSLLLLCTPSPAPAQTIATTFAELRIAPGSAVVVTDRGGRETSGRVASLSGSTLSLIVDGQARPFMEADTLRISRDGDSLKNGALWGLGTGAAMGILAARQGGTARWRRTDRGSARSRFRGPAQFLKRASRLAFHPGQGRPPGRW